MKKWETPELFELKAVWTENTLGYEGGDQYGSSVNIPGFGDVPIGPGSCCC